MTKFVRFNLLVLGNQVALLIKSVKFYKSYDSAELFIAFLSNLKLKYSMRTFKITISREHLNKHKGAKIGLTVRPKPFEGTIENILEHIAAGFPILACELKNYEEHRNNLNWKQQRLLVIDIDCGLSIKEAIEDSFLQSYAMVLFTSFTHNKLHDCSQCKQKDVRHDKFRLLFALPEYLKHPVQVRFLNLIFRRLYKHDRNCIPEASMYCGNDETEITYFDTENTLDYGALWLEYATRIDKRERTSDIQKALNHNYQDELTVEERAKYLLDMFKDNKEFCFEITKSIYINNEFSNNLAKAGVSLPLQLSPPTFERKMQDFKWTYFLDHCPRCRDFSDTTHEEDLMFATNFSKIQGGSEKFIELTADRPKSHKGQNYYKDMLKPAYHYPLYSCKDNCSLYGHECTLGVENIIEVQPIKWKEVRIIEPHMATNSLEESRANLSEDIRRVLEAPGNGVFGIIADTGVGKTDAIEKAALPNECTVSASMYDILKLINRGSLYPQIPKELAEAFKPFYHIGLQPEKNEIELYLERLPDGKELLSQYVQFKAEQRQILKEPLIRLTHHRDILDRSVRRDCLHVHDEDFIDILLRTGTINAIALRELCDCLQDAAFSNCRRIFEEILQSPENIVHLTPKRNGEYNIANLAILLNEKYLRGNGQQIGNVLGLLNSMAYCKVTRGKSAEITFMAKNGLPEGKHLTLSATLDTLAWRLLYPNIQIFDTGRTKPKANMIQIMDDSFCITSLMNDTKKCQYLLELNARARAQGYATATHLEIRKRAYKDFDAHFFGLEGMRRLEKRDFAVFGTPNHPDVLLALKAVVLGITEAPFPVSFYYGGNGLPQAVSRIVEYNGMEFRYQMLYENKTLQQLQLDFTRRQLIQSTGRPRPLANDCTIALFSTFPMMNDGFSRNANPF